MQAGEGRERGGGAAVRGDHPGGRNVERRRRSRSRKSLARLASTVVHKVRAVSLKGS